MSYRNRREAGQLLAETLSRYAEENPVVLGLPRGGVSVAFEVAQRLGAPLDVVVVRKVGVPYQPELGLGAVGEDGVRVVNDSIVRGAGVTPAQLSKAEAAARQQLQHRVEVFRRVQPKVALAGRLVVIVDDGIATGSTARAACQVVRAQGATRIVVAAPVGSPDAVVGLHEVADEVVCLEQPRRFYAIGQFYDDFTQVDDDAVVALLRSAQDAS